MKTQILLFLKGGKGGFGNYKFKSSKNIAPKKANVWISRRRNVGLDLRLNLIADIGIIGLPNAGKSSFLKFVTNANPKVARLSFYNTFS